MLKIQKFPVYGESVWIWTSLVHIVPTTSRSVCFSSSVPTLLFFYRYGSITSFRYYVSIRIYVDSSIKSYVAHTQDFSHEHRLP